MQLWAQYVDPEGFDAPLQSALGSSETEGCETQAPLKSRPIPTMQDTPAVLLLDDGELESVAELLDRSQLPYCRLRGAEISHEIAPPLNLLVSTPRHAGKARRGSPPGALAGRPVRIIAVEEDSPSLRRMLRTMGFSLLVRQPAHSEVWRLLIQRALYQGDERRRETRLPMGSQIWLENPGADGAAARATRTSLLVDISNRGCHFIGDEPFEVGSHLVFEIETVAGSGERLVLSGEIVRSGPSTKSGNPKYSCAMAFGPDVDDSSRMQLARMINSKISGPLSLAQQCPESLSLPSCDSPALPGLLLDDETDPPVATEFEVQLAMTARRPLSETARSERRKDRRTDYLQRIEAQNSGETSVLMGRNLSANGMCVEHFADARIGAFLNLAIYGSSESAPLQVEAEIIRDDGERGIGLRFCDLPRETSAQLEKFVACLPAVESLEDGEALGMGSVLAEVLPTGAERD